MTETEEEIRKGIQAYAQTALQEFAPLSGLGDQFGYNVASVDWVAGFIERVRQDPSYGHKPGEGLINILGAYLGECVICIYGGEWKLNKEQGWGILLKDGKMAFPFTRVQNQFDYGVKGGKSIRGFLDFIATFQKPDWPPKSKE